MTDNQVYDFAKTIVQQAKKLMIDEPCPSDIAIKALEIAYRSAPMYKEDQSVADILDSIYLELNSHFYKEE